MISDATYEKDLNEEQRLAVLHGNGNLLVLAGAGSGKTRVLTYRFARLVNACGVPPPRVLAVTFTNKAAAEMKERIHNLLGREYGSLWIGTFHSLSARIIREIAPRIGVERNYSIFDEDDRKRMIRSICRDLGLDPTAERIGRIIGEIRRRKSKLHAENGGRRDGLFLSPSAAEADKVFPIYETALRRMNAFDFDDLLAVPVRVFHERKDILEEYALRFKHLLVDEFQDTNWMQNELIRLLSGKHGNVCAVGDDDQSIYGWRGAEVRHILEFEKSFPDAKVMRLERNYRSTKPILDAASAVIEKNEGRRGKRLWTDREGGDPITRDEFRSEREEGLNIAREIMQAIGDSGVRPRDFALFYRTNAQSRSLEEGLRLHAIPYVIVGGTRFYERREVKDLLAYLRLLYNEKDDVSFGRVLNVPARGIGEKTRERLADFAGERGLSLLEALGRSSEIEGIGPRAKKLLDEFCDLLRGFFEMNRTSPPSDTIRSIVEELCYIEILQEKDPEKGIGRGENVMELVSAVAEFEERYPGCTLADFLAEVSLLTDLDDWKDAADAVTLMTLHNSKGLEFPIVYITGVEEGLLPHLLSTGDQAGIEEERRLFYVGMTRAIDKVTLSSVASRIRYGEIAPSVPSRFLREIPRSLVLDRSGRRVERSQPARRPADDFPDYENESQETATLVVEDWIRHGAWGKGCVLAVEGSGEKMKATIRFDAGFTKKVMIRYAVIEKI